MTNLAQLEPFVDECSSLLRTRLTEFADQKRTIDIAHWMQCYAFDVIGQITVSGRTLQSEFLLTCPPDLGSKALRLSRYR
jgi:hypothetical protein